MAGRQAKDLDHLGRFAAVALVQHEVDVAGEEPRRDVSEARPARRRALRSSRAGLGGAAPSASSRGGSGGAVSSASLRAGSSGVVSTKASCDAEATTYAVAPA